MIMRKPALALLLLVGLLAYQPSYAQKLDGISVAARVGSLGPGLELTTALSPQFNVRLAGHYVGYSRTDTITDLEIDVQSDTEVILTSGAVFADFFPSRRGFRVSAGLVYNRNRADVLITPLEEYVLNENKTFTPEKIGTVSAKVGHKSQLNPYLGIGFGNSVRPGTRFGFVFDLGVLYTGSPKVEMSGTEIIKPTATQASKIEEDLKGLKLYPLLSLGFSYKI